MTAEAAAPVTGEENQEPEQPEGAQPEPRRSDDVGRMEAALRKANREAERLRLQLKERDDADLSETERLRSSLADSDARTKDLETKLQEVRVEQAVERAAVKLGVVDPEAAVLMLDLSALEYRDDGKPKDSSVEAALKALIERKPYLAGKRSAGSGDGGPRGGGSPPQSMNDWIRGVAGATR